MVAGLPDGILQATARRLSALGARIVLCDAEVSDAMTSHFAADLSREGEARRLLDFIEREFGRLDLMVNGPPRTPDIDWPDTADDQLLAAASPAIRHWAGSVHAAAPLLARAQGRIVSVVSSVGRYRSGYFRPAKATLSSTPEALAHGAILALIRQLALELAPKRVRLNAVVVGLLEGAVELAQMSETERRYLLEEISMGRPGTPEEVAAVIAFLASSASNYLTGTAVDVNGGWWMS